MSTGRLHPPEPNGLDETERAFVGIFPPRLSDGWVSAESIAVLASMADDDGQPWMSDEERRLLQVLCKVPDGLRALGASEG